MITEAGCLFPIMEVIMHFLIISVYTKNIEIFVSILNVFSLKLQREMNQSEQNCRTICGVRLPDELEVECTYCSSYLVELQQRFNSFEYLLEFQYSVSKLIIFGYYEIAILFTCKLHLIN